MYLKTNFIDVDNTINIGKAIKCEKLIKILKKLPKDSLLSCNRITNDISVFNKELRQLGWIDIAEDKFEKY